MVKPTQFRSEVKELVLTLLRPGALAAPPLVLAPTFIERWRLVTLVSIHSSLAPPEVMRDHRSGPSLEWGFDNQSFFFSGRSVGIFKDWVDLRCVCVGGGLGALFLR
jgi:hypothetical protein